MTTIIGMNAGKGNKGVVLASDCQATYMTDSMNPVSKGPIEKIDISEAREVAIGMSGVFDEHYTEFLTKVIKGDIDIRKVVDEGYFRELRDLNSSRWKTLPDQRMNGLLLATRFDNNPQLYTCWPMGQVEPRGFTVIGSGQELPLEYFTSKRAVSLYEEGKSCLDPENLSLEDAIGYSYIGLEAATSQDVYSSGVNLVVVEEGEIKEYGPGIREKAKVAEREEVRRIQKLYASEE